MVNNGSFTLVTGLGVSIFFFPFSLHFPQFFNGHAIHSLSEEGDKLCSGDKATQTTCSAGSDRTVVIYKGTGGLAWGKHVSASSLITQQLIY